MNKKINIIVKIVIIILLIYTWRLIEANGSAVNKFYIYLYLSLVSCSLLSDKYFYKGQKTENNKSHLATSHYLSLTWFVTLIVPVIEYVYLQRDNLLFTVSGSILIISGIIIRGLAIKRLGKFFSRDIENWEEQKIIKSGIYKYVRHPAYTGNIIQIIAFPLVLNSYFSLFFSLITIAGFLWRIKVEEEILIDKLPEYKEYMEETKKLLPKIW
ncbi:isoprenylcysteine carboxyl methyltransferase (ICMT) family protein [Halanaerobium saccharolyticum]|uniref:Isoprenylcysteine carboxyl methyltransferase (ICMT) family protein n=1 Tax=Halanaerobium saccharolyticum TaxID=43595 RepID=A0A4R6LPI4_9FIRM|nr:isoprenylcysteine carboxylmethyltransferase family protein [Halanaerobium saccharolyticum]TDO89325.1 isoprenylcysteine carboxyl methyltransferase (ICMT) family protein [Halanaerobium saccharolyticum]